MAKRTYQLCFKLSPSASQQPHEEPRVHVAAPLPRHGPGRAAAEVPWGEREGTQAPQEGPRPSPQKPWLNIPLLGLVSRLRMSYEALQYIYLYITIRMERKERRVVKESTLSHLQLPFSSLYNIRICTASLGGYGKFEIFLSQIT